MKQTLEEMLASHTAEGTLWEKLPDGRIRCFACAHRCAISEGKHGVCYVRFNQNGKLRVPFNYVAALQDDPIEKKPFFHALPGARILSFGMLGCDYHCAYCQNWMTSQALRDPQAGTEPQIITACEIVKLAVDRGCEAVASTYNEPLITSEWAVEVFKEAKAHDLVTAFISNGNATPEALDYLKPHLDLYKVDLKSFNDKHYRELGGTLEAVCESIRLIYEKKIWLEVLTLLIPGFNDSPEELKQLAEFVVSVSPEIPWHVTAYHRDYKMQNHCATTAMDLIKACEIGKKAGLRYVYSGNLPGQTGERESTFCPECGKRLIHRKGFSVYEDLVSSAGGKCLHCSTKIPGFWNK